MAKEVKLRQSGGSVSATLPKDMADRLRLEAGDRVLAVETGDGILEQIREHGGLPRIRDENVLESR